MERQLPEELIAEILLSNLPIKSLLRFKSVSKSWRSVISSAKFVKDHINRSNSDPDFTHHNLVGIFHNKQTGFILRSCSLKSLLNEPDQNDVVPTWDHHHPTGFSPIQILGSCNGLILITIKRSLFLWNPSMRKLKSVPPSSCPQGKRADQRLENIVAGTTRQHPRLWDYFVYGVGYDDSTDDYKVVWIISYSVPGYTEIHQTKIYSVRTGSWKEIENFGKPFQTESPGIFVNGKLHWLGVKEDRWKIVSLGLVEGQEKYQVVATPWIYGNCLPRLGNFGGYLSLVCPALLDINVWAMIKYGVAESWTRIWTFPDFYNPDRPLFCGASAKPFWATEKGDIFVVFHQSSEIVVYNGKSKLRDYQLGRINQPLVYVESLVSP